MLRCKVILPTCLHDPTLRNEGFETDPTLAMSAPMTCWPGREIIIGGTVPLVMNVHGDARITPRKPLQSDETKKEGVGATGIRAYTL